MKPRLTVRAASFPGKHVAEAFVHVGGDIGELVELSPRECLEKGRDLYELGLNALRREDRSR